MRPAIIRERLEPIRNIIRVTNLNKLDVFSIDGFTQDFARRESDRTLDGRLIIGHKIIDYRHSTGCNLRCVCVLGSWNHMWQRERIRTQFSQLEGRHSQACVDCGSGSGVNSGS